MMYIKEKALCLPFLKNERDAANRALYSDALEALHKQAEKFKVRL
jgi:hypothetical protein